MANSILEASMIKRMSLLVVILCILFSFKSKDTEIENLSSPSPLSSDSEIKTPPTSSWDLNPSIFMSMDDGGGEADAQLLRSLEYDFYRDSCPQAEKIIHQTVQEMYNAEMSVAPALLRLAFHDCFIEGCDASILLDNAQGIKSEKDAFPNQSLKGFRIIDIIKSRIEEICPGVVSCADTVVLAARDGIVQAGGPFYPLLTGRRDSTQSFPDTALSELPSPQADLSETLASFASRGFDERETVSVLESPPLPPLQGSASEIETAELSVIESPPAPPLQGSRTEIETAEAPDIDLSGDVVPAPAPAPTPPPPATPPTPASIPSSSSTAGKQTLAVAIYFFNLVI